MWGQAAPRVRGATLLFSSYVALGKAWELSEVLFHSLSGVFSTQI